MRIEDVKKLEPVEQFIYWIRERHNIHKKRKAGHKPPWTDDEVLANNFFTSPFRELDKISCWFREFIRDPLRDVPGVVFATMVFRWFNWIPTGHLLIDEDLIYESTWNWKRANRLLEELRARDGQVFTGAFLISPAGSTKPKVQRICEDYIDVFHKDVDDIVQRIKDDGTLQGCWKILHEYPGLGAGGFMAYEIVCDLRYTYLLENAPDIYTWTNLGPGAKKGMSLLQGADRPHKKVGTKEEQLEFCRQLLLKTKKRLMKFPDIDMRTIEHSLCEFQKYHRVLYDYGRSKRKYNQEEGYKTRSYSTIAHKGKWELK